MHLAVIGRRTPERLAVHDWVGTLHSSSSEEKAHKKQKTLERTCSQRVVHAIHAIIPPKTRYAAFLPRPPAEGLDPHTIELLEYLHIVIITIVLLVAPLCANIVPFFGRAQDSGGIIDSAL